MFLNLQFQDNCSFNKTNLENLKYALPLAALGCDNFPELNILKLRLPKEIRYNEISNPWIQKLYKFHSEVAEPIKSELLTDISNIILEPSKINRNLLSKFTKYKFNLAQKFILYNCANGHTNELEAVLKYISIVSPKNSWSIFRFLLSKIKYNFHRFYVLRAIIQLNDTRNLELIIFHYYRIQDIYLKQNTKISAIYDYREIELILKFLSDFSLQKVKIIFEKEFLNIYSNTSKIVCMTLINSFKVEPSKLIEKSIGVLTSPKNYLYDTAIQNLALFVNFSFNIDGSQIVDIFLNRKQLHYTGDKNLNYNYSRFMLYNYNPKVPKMLFKELAKSKDHHVITNSTRILETLVLVSSKNIPIYISRNRINIIRRIVFSEDQKTINLRVLKLLTFIVLKKSNKKAKRTIIDIATDPTQSNHNRTFAFSELNIIQSIIGIDQALFKYYQNAILINDKFLKTTILRGLNLFPNPEAKKLLNETLKQTDEYYSDNFKIELDYPSIDEIQESLNETLSIRKDMKGGDKSTWFSDKVHQALNKY